MARTQEFDANEALDRAVGVFWDKGYFDTSMDDLVEAMGVARYGVYGTWGNKRELFLAVLRKYVDQRIVMAQGTLGEADASLPEIRAFFAGVLERSSEKYPGCLICNAAAELAPHDKEVAGLVRQLFDQLSAGMKGALENAVRNGELETDRDLGELADYLAGILRGAALAHSAGYSRAHIESEMNIALSVLD